MKIRVIFRAVLLMLLFTVFFTSSSVAGTAVKVMTYNVDEGTDFSPIVDVLTNGGDLVTALQQTLAEVQNSHPELRAKLIANEIATAQPDLVGLQEAAHWTFPNGQETEDIDLLQLILGYLGSQYQPKVIVPEFQINITQLGVAFTDRDVILVRSDLVNAITGQNQGYYSTLIPLPAFPPYLPTPTALTRGWGYVDVAMNGTEVRFITTHLEDGTNSISPLFALVQALQEIELVYSPNAPAATPLPVIIGGDFNTIANDPTSPTYLTYLFMLGNGFIDAWTKGHPRLGGATCCQEHLTFANSELTQRIDQVFARNHVTVIKTQLVGDAIVPNVVGDVGYWPSDHASVESQLQVGSLP